MNAPAAKQRDLFSAYLRKQNVRRIDSHESARTCGRWQAVVTGADGWVRMFTLSDDRTTRNFQLRIGAMTINRRLMAAQKRGVVSAFAIRWKRDPEA